MLMGQCRCPGVPVPGPRCHGPVKETSQVWSKIRASKIPGMVRGIGAEGLNDEQ